MAKTVSAETRHDLLQAIRERYGAGTKDEGVRILDEFVAVTGYHRKHVIRLFTTKALVRGVSRRTRLPVYDDVVREALVVLWEASDRVCGKRLKPDDYDEIAVADFPDTIALARETGGRIPATYHKLENHPLCLGSRVRLRLQMGGSRSVLRFVERCVIPYLYGYSHFVKTGVMPFDELEHGELGTLQDLASLLNVDMMQALWYCRLATLKKRRANNICARAAADGVSAAATTGRSTCFATGSAAPCSLVNLA